MCLIAFSYKHHPDYDLILAANRDEFYQRRTRKARFWESHPQLLAGKDLEAGGTWLGITKSGRLSALTNYRDSETRKPDAPSRGQLPLNYLTDEIHPKQYLQEVRLKASQYNGFNLLVGKPRSLYYISNKTLNIEKLQPGVHGISNHLLDTPWPKVEKARSRLDRITLEPDFTTDDIFEMLHDQTKAPTPLLPDTGVGMEKEKELSSIFIDMEEYGTRSSTVLLISREGKVTFEERYYNNRVDEIGECSYTFTIF